MKKSNITLIVIAAVVATFLIVSSLTFFRPHTSGYAVKTSASGTQNSGTLFSQSPYYKMAYQIFPGPLSSNARKATTGFNIQMKNGSAGTTINIVATNPAYKNQSYTLTSGDKLYFIERTLIDDSNGEDRFPTDDMAVVVNSQGYIVQGSGSA